MLTRRYLCKKCGAVITVVPRGLLPQLRYHLGGIAAALGLWWSGLSSGEVWRRCSAFSTAGRASPRDWPSLGRWTKLLGRIMGVTAAGETSFQSLERVLQLLASLAPQSSGDLAFDAVEGASFIDAHRFCTGGHNPPTS